nr:sigma-E factor negative regulatory protein [Pseudomonas sp.]
MSAVQTRSGATVMQDEESGDVLSAFMDGEADMPAFLTRSADARRDWDTYHLIGDVLRSEALARPVSARFSQQLRQALEAEPPIVAPRRRPLQRIVGRYAAPGAALAIAVVAATWMAQPYISPTSSSLQASTPPSPSTRNTLASASLPV